MYALRKAAWWGTPPPLWLRHWITWNRFSLNFSKWATSHCHPHKDNGREKLYASNTFGGHLPRFLAKGKSEDSLYSMERIIEENLRKLLVVFMISVNGPKQKRAWQQQPSFNFTLHSCPQLTLGFRNCSSIFRLWSHSKFASTALEPARIECDFTTDNSHWTQDTRKQRNLGDRTRRRPTVFASITKDKTNLAMTDSILHT